MSNTPPKWREDDEEEEGEGGEFDEDGDAGYLSLNMKPDRNMALLDEYEQEELGEQSSDPNHRSGYVAVLGKSTFLNQMIGQKLCIVTDKPQTTRHRILGICSGEDYQMVLYDTPGVIGKNLRKLDSI